jgi:branched-chain amino acid transport system permease protein
LSYVTVLQLVLTGVLVGGIYGLIAMGFVIVYRSARVFNMAYGQFAVLGAYVAWTFIGSPNAPRLPLPLAILCTLAFAVAFGLFIERLIFRHMIGKPIFTSFIMTLGLLAIFNSLIMIVWGAKTRVLAPTVPTGPVNFGGLVLSMEYIWTFAIAMVIMGAFMFFFQRTRLGLAIRAAYSNQIVARCLGVSAKLNAQIAWVICSIIATMGGILIGSVQGVSTTLSEMVMVVLVVVLIGGMDSIAGCIAGGLILAIGQNLANYYLSTYLPGIGNVFGLIVILIILLFRPNGIFGAKPVERV